MNRIIICHLLNGYISDIYKATHWYFLYKATPESWLIPGYNDSEL